MSFPYTNHTFFIFYMVMGEFGRRSFFPFQNSNEWIWSEEKGREFEQVSIPFTNHINIWALEPFCLWPAQWANSWNVVARLKFSSKYYPNITPSANFYSVYTNYTWKSNQLEHSHPISQKMSYFTSSKHHFSTLPINFT